MKHYLKFCLALLVLVVPVTAWAAPSSDLLVVDPVKNQIEKVNPATRAVEVLKIGGRPFKLKPLPDKAGYLLLCQGVSKLFGGVNTPGELVYLDSKLQPTAKKVTLPGLVVKELFLEEYHLWLVITKSDRNIVLNMVNLATGAHQQVPLQAVPIIYQINPDGTRMALATVDPENHSGANVILVDLKTSKATTYQTGLNPGAIYFTSPTQIMVACGGYRDSQKYPSGGKVQTASKAIPASLQLIDLESGKVESIEVDYSPLAIIQDQKNSDTFYLTSSPQANPAEPSSVLRIVTNGKVTAQLMIADEITRIIQAPGGNLCLLGQLRFYLINPQETKILREIVTDLKIETVRISPDGKIGYVFIVNSSTVDIIDLATGNSIDKIKLSRNTFMDTLKSFSVGTSLFLSPLPPVTGDNPVFENKIDNSPANQRMIFAADQNRLYLLTGKTELKVIDLQTNQTRNTVRFSGYASGIHQVPHGKYLVAVANTHWNLIDPDKNKPVLTVKIGEDQKPAQQGYYSPDGSLLAVPYNNNLYLINTETATFIGKVKIKAQNPLVIWP
jgi:DNA-binding beta-propeller fold protein YncE